MSGSFEVVICLLILEHADICSIYVSSFPYFVISVYFTGTFLHSINFEREEGDLPQILTRRFKKKITNRQNPNQ